MSFTPQQLANIADLYSSSQNAGFLSIGLCALMMYEYLITFEDERKNFWKGPFSVSHALFFFNRYFSLLIVSLSFLVVMLSFDTYFNGILIRRMFFSCRHAIRANFYTSAIGLGVIQAILTTRVWFLFPGNKAVYGGLLFSFAVSFLTTIIFMALSLSHLTVLPRQFFHIPGFVSQSGCHAKRPPMFWTVYLPSLVLHTGLYFLTVYQSLYGTECSRRRDLRRILILDGSLFYFIMLASVMIVTVGSFLQDVRQLNLASIFTPIVICTTSIATSRIMFGLRSYFLEVENNLGWEPTTPLGPTRHRQKGSLADSLQITSIITPLPRMYNMISFGPHYHVRHDDVEEERERVFDRKMASFFSD